MLSSPVITRFNGLTLLTFPCVPKSFCVGIKILLEEGRKVGFALETVPLFPVFCAEGCGLVERVSSLGKFVLAPLFSCTLGLDRAVFCC